MRKVFFALLVLAIAAIAGSAASSPRAAAAAGAPTTIHLVNAGITSFSNSAPATSVTTDPTSEIDPATMSDADASDNGHGGVDRSLVGALKGNGASISSSKKAKSNPELGANWQGLNFHDQRFANGGNQFSVEPPDQGLCAGSGYELEAVNDVAQVYDTAGHALLNGGNAVDLNTFYGYPAAINRTTGARGPELTDPTCIYDSSVNRFFLVVLTLDRVGVSNNLSGTNHLDLAVSNTSNPTGTWTIYHLPVQNDGTQGTPNDNCNGPCLGDYPHIGNDANGIYLTTNEFSLFNDGFFGSQIYAISKSQLAAGAASPTVVHFNTLGMGPDGGGFTVWPAQTSDGQYATDNGGSEYFMSSRAVFTDSGVSDSILQWTMSNTASLNSASPSPALGLTQISVSPYAVPGLATQKSGDFPLQQCIADLPCAIAVGAGSLNNTSWGGLNSNDSRMQQVAYANGKLWGALDTEVSVGGQDRSGIAYYVLNPSNSKLLVQGQMGAAGQDFTYPAIGVLPNGRGVMAFTLTGDNDYPSAAYAGIDAKVGAGDVHVAAAGAGPDDGFTQYPFAFGSGPRWGDYGAAAVMGNSIWIASEYVAQTCTYATYRATNFTCGNTRGALGNWSTHISQITP